MLWLTLLYLVGSATAATVTLPLARRAVGPRSETFRESLSGANNAFLTPLSVGTPPLTIYALLDTGSSDLVLETAVQADSCKNCTTSGALYSANASSTANATETWVGIQYGSSAVAGVLVSDVVKFGDFNSTQTFVAANRNVNFTTNALQSSLLGLGWASAAQTNATPYVEHLWRQGLLDEPLFALALSPSNGPDIQADVGFLTIGGTNSSQYTGEIQYIDRPSVPGVLEGLWGMKIDDVVVNGKRLGLGSEHGMLDSGTTSLALPPEVASAIYGSIPGSVSDEPGLYLYPCDPKVNLTFVIGGTAYPIHPDDFQLGGVEEDGVCVGAVLAFDDPDERWIIGVPFMYSYYSVFNFEKPGIGLAPMSRAVVRSDLPKSSSKSHWAVIGPVVAGIALLGVVAAALGMLLWRRRGRITSSRSKDIPKNTTTVQGN